MTISTNKITPTDISVSGDPINDYLSILVGSDCRFNSGATGYITGRSFNISYAWPWSPWSSFTTVKIDDHPNVYGSSGAIVQPPTDLSNLTNESICQWGAIQVKQTLEIVFSPSTGRPDTGMYKYTVTNNDTTAHNVGIRIMIDTMLNNNDGAPFRIPTVGPVTTEMEFYNPDIPQYWQAFYTLSDPNIMAQGTLIGGEATPPDRFALTAWPSIYGTSWDYTINPSQPVTSDSAATIWWNPVNLNPGESQEFITYYGLGTVSGNADLSITGPASLSVISNQWSPNPFTVTAYIANNTGISLSNVPVTLSLSTGLNYASGESATHIINNIEPGLTAQTYWNIVALQEGEWEYFATALNQTVERSVIVPPLVGDTVPPLTSCFIIPEPNTDGWNKTDITVTLNAVDNMGGSGVKEVHYQLVGDSEMIVPGSNATFNITNEGVTNFLYWAVDNVSNIEPQQTRAVKIDKTAPILTINSPTSGAYLTTDSITIDYTVNDGISGVKTIAATLDGMSVMNGEVINLSGRAGTHNFTITSVDYADNVTSQSVDFTVLVAATVDIKPDTLNLDSSSNENSVTGYIELTSEYDAVMIDVSTVQLIVNNITISALLTPTEVGDYNYNGIRDKMVKFNRQEVIAALDNMNGNIIFTVKGQLYDDLSFTGIDVVRVIHGYKR